MTTTEKTIITVEATVHAPVEKVWEFWTVPKHIQQWNNASDDWHTPHAENDLKAGGKFLSRMEARDGSMGFDFEGIYDEVKKHELVSYSLDDDRKVRVVFIGNGNSTKVTESFEAETTHTIEMQREGWQAILDNFKQYVESSGKFVRQHFEISINAPVRKVYDTMLDKEKYVEWAALFSPGSHYEGSWNKGSKILFLSPGMEGMVGHIKENIPLKFVSIEHLGFVHKGKEITSGPEIEPWAGAMENYTFREENGATVVSVSVDTNEEYKDYFSETWPKALAKLKAICES